MPTLLVNFNPSHGAGNADVSENMTTTMAKSTGTAVSKASSGEIELFSNSPHQVHIGATPDADGPNAFFVFPNFPKRVKVGKGVKVSAKSLTML